MFAFYSLTGCAYLLPTNRTSMDTTHGPRALKQLPLPSSEGILCVRENRSPHA